MNSAELSFQISQDPPMCCAICRLLTVLNPSLLRCFASFKMDFKYGEIFGSRAAVKMIYAQLCW